MFTTHTAFLSSSGDGTGAALQGDSSGDRHQQHHSRCLQLTPPPSPLVEMVEVLLFKETVGETGINNIILESRCLQLTPPQSVLSFNKASATSF
jgi:hypothetical protein